MSCKAWYTGETKSNLTHWMSEHKGYAICCYKKKVSIFLSNKISHTNDHSFSYNMVSPCTEFAYMVR